MTERGEMLAQASRSTGLEVDHGTAGNRTGAQTD